MNASLWQSAVDQVIARENAASPAAGLSPFEGVFSGNSARPDQSNPMMIDANAIAQALEKGEIPEAPAISPAAGVVDAIKFCSATAFKLAEARVRAFLTGDDAEFKMLQAQLKEPFGECDPRWAQVLEIYVANRIADKTIPYRRNQNPGDFVIADRLPAKATIALLADWGTGQACAKALLERIAAREPDVVVHLGDVYYSGTQHEVQNYFYAIWRKALGLPQVEWGKKPDGPQKPATFHLAGNHDMYAGGGPYYTVIDMLGQPASYFCLRNEHWQFIAMDTGLHDSNPTKEGSPTWLEDSEVAWLKDKVNHADGRKTILLSHHQLFSASDRFDGGPVNEKLYAQLEDILPKVTAWFWGHEHNLVIYGKYRNVLGRCIGHGAFPVSCEDVKALNPEVPVAAVTLSKDADGFFEHGYATMRIDGPDATVVYYQYNADGSETALFTETL